LKYKRWLRTWKILPTKVAAQANANQGHRPIEKSVLPHKKSSDFSK